MQTEKPVRIAVVTLISGRAAGPFGLPGRNAAELLIEAINAGGELPVPYASKGFAGRRLVLTVHDEAGSPTEQAELFRRIHESGAEGLWATPEAVLQWPLHRLPKNCIS
jgi:branched-chain amino acid transport system substrate-binding protein